MQQLEVPEAALKEAGKCIRNTSFKYATNFRLHTSLNFSLLPSSNQGADTSLRIGESLIAMNPKVCRLQIAAVSIRIPSPRSGTTSLKLGKGKGVKYLIL